MTPDLFYIPCPSFTNSFMFMFSRCEHLARHRDLFVHLVEFFANRIMPSLRTRGRVGGALARHRRAPGSAPSQFTHEPISSQYVQMRTWCVGNACSFSLYVRSRCSNDFLTIFMLFSCEKYTNVAGRFFKKQFVLQIRFFLSCAGSRFSGFSHWISYWISYWISNRDPL